MILSIWCVTTVVACVLIVRLLSIHVIVPMFMFIFISGKICLTLLWQFWTHFQLIRITVNWLKMFLWVGGNGNSKNRKLGYFEVCVYFIECLSFWRRILFSFFFRCVFLFRFSTNLFTYDIFTNVWSNLICSFFLLFFLFVCFSWNLFILGVSICVFVTQNTIYRVFFFVFK